MDQWILMLPCCALLACYQQGAAPWRTYWLATLLALALSLPATWLISLFAPEPYRLLLWLGAQLGSVWASGWLLRRMSISASVFTNALVLLVSLVQLQGALSLASATFNSALAAVLFTGCYAALSQMHATLEHTALPPYFKGQPIMLISAGLLGYALFALAGFGIL